MWDEIHLQYDSEATESIITDHHKVSLGLKDLIKAPVQIEQEFVLPIQFKADKLSLDPTKTTTDFLISPPLADQPIFPPPSVIPCRQVIMSQELACFFYGLKNGQKDAEEFIKKVETCVIQEQHPTTEIIERITKIKFRTHLKGAAERWYRSLTAEARSSWTELKQRFMTEYNAPVNDEMSLEKHYDIIQSIWQRGRHIVQYVRDVENIYMSCPTSLSCLLGRQFIAGLDD